MSTDDLHLERRASQRFDFQLPVGVRLAGTDCEGYGFTQDLSGRGVFSTPTIVSRKAIQWN